MKNWGKATEIGEVSSSRTKCNEGVRPQGEGSFKFDYIHNSRSVYRVNIYYT
jgi:hypothetical protein